MGAAERREREKSEFRDLVLRAARKIVAKEGFDGLSMRKIAEAIEYAPGTIYLYFESRDAIAQELCQRGFGELLQAFAPAAGIADPIERLREIGKRYIRFGMERQETYRLIFMENPKYSDTVFDEEDESSPGHLALQFLVDAFEELRTQKRLRVDFDSKTLAEATWAAMHGIVSLKLTMTGYPEAGAEDLALVMMEALFNGYLS
jgi:AcrR family transcriptional regulator